MVLGMSVWHVPWVVVSKGLLEGESLVVAAGDCQVYCNVLVKCLSW